MSKFSTTVNCLGQEITVESATFLEHFKALAGISDLNRDYRYFHKRTDALIKDRWSLAPVNNRPAKAPSPNIYLSHSVITEKGKKGEYFKLREFHTQCNQTLGQLNEENPIIGLFPKADDGFYNPEEQTA